MQYSKRLIFCHVDLVEHAEATMLCAKVHGAGAEADLAALERVHADEARGVHVHVERHVPCGTGEDLGEVFRQHVFASGLAAREQQVLPAQQRRQRRLPHVLAIIMIPRLRDAVLQLRRRRILRVKFTNAIQKVGTQPLLFQKIQQIDHSFLPCALHVLFSVIIITRKRKFASKSFAFLQKTYSGFLLFAQVRRDMPPAGGRGKGDILFREREYPLWNPKRKAFDWQFRA